MGKVLIRLMMDLNLKENMTMASQSTEKTSIVMDRFTRVILRKISLAMDMASIPTRMAVSKKVNGKTILRRAKESALIKMGRNSN